MGNAHIAKMLGSHHGQTTLANVVDLVEEGLATYVVCYEETEKHKLRRKHMLL